MGKIGSRRASFLENSGMSDMIHSEGAVPRAAQTADARASSASVLRAPSGVPHRAADQASDLVKRLFRSFDGSLVVRLWNGTAMRLGKAAANVSEPRFTLVCRNPNVVRSMVLGRDRLRLAEAYFRGDIDIEAAVNAATFVYDESHDTAG